MCTFDSNIRRFIAQNTKDRNQSSGLETVQEAGNQAARVLAAGARVGVTRDEFSHDLQHGHHASLDLELPAHTWAACLPISVVYLSVHSSLWETSTFSSYMTLWVLTITYYLYNSLSFQT